MADHWMMTWHEGGAISPGVPDLHYSMGPEYKVGWLELKSLDNEIGSPHPIKVEPSQHQYFRRWLPRMPIHFLVRANKIIYLVSAEYHTAIPQMRSPNEICAISLAYFPQAEIAVKLPPLLKQITRI